MDELLVFKTKATRDESKTMRVSNSFDTLVTYIKRKTDLPIYVITHEIAAYLADKIVIDNGFESELIFRKDKR